MLKFTDATNGNPIAINPDHVVVLFTSLDDTGANRTVLNMLNGNVAVSEDYITVLAALGATN